MKVTIICPECHQKMIYRGGNVMVSLLPDEIGKVQKVEVVVCEKCGLVQTSFFFQVNVNKEGQQ